MAVFSLIVIGLFMWISVKLALWLHAHGKEHILTEPVTEPKPMMYRHYKGGLYTEIIRGQLESDQTPMVVYRGEDGRIWIRPAAEFDDGRFKPLNPTDYNKNLRHFTIE